MADDNAQTGNQQAPGGQIFNIAKIFLKDVSFEAPNAPQVFQAGEWAPQVNVDLGTNARAITENTYEVLLSVTVTTKLGDKTAYLCEIKQGGVFQIAGFDEQTLRGVLGSYCPSVLFPYAREAVSDLVTKGGFPQMVLGPVNFDALYAQKLQEGQQNAAPAPTERH
jgi:preprotein translocase subunit SecB